MKKRFAEAPLGETFGGFGRILVKKHLGKIAFFTVRFCEENIQLILEKSSLENFDDMVKATPGSSIHFTGVKCLSKSGEPSIKVLNITITGACLPTLPDKFHGLTQAHRYEERMLDLLINEEVFHYFACITDVVKRMREFLWDQGFREFNTGVLQEFFEGGLAKSFSTHCNANDKTYHLNLTSEVKLKRLLVGGFDKVFEILQSFRNEGIDAMHSPEFSLLEVFQIGADCTAMMELTESMITHSFSSIYPDLQIPIIEQNAQTIVNLKPPFDRISFHKLCYQVLGLTEEHCNLETMIQLFPDAFNEDMHRFTWIFKVINKFLSPTLKDPTFIIDIPSGISPFVRVNSQNPSVSERAALIINATDIADIYTDENRRDIVEQAMLHQASWTGKMHNQSYVKLLEYGLPQTASIGLGINRLLLMLRGNLPANIKETILYPIK